MSDLAKTIIKWVLLIALTALVIFLIIKISNKNTKKKASEEIRSIEKIKLEDEDEEEKNKEKEGDSTLMVNLGDTASTRGVSVWIGTVILGTTSLYLYKRQKVSE